MGACAPSAAAAVGLLAVVRLVAAHLGLALLRLFRHGSPPYAVSASVSQVSARRHCRPKDRGHPRSVVATRSPDFAIGSGSVILGRLTHRVRPRFTTQPSCRWLRPPATGRP